MGYVRKRTVYRLVWEDDHDLAGLIVQVGALNTGQLVDLTTGAARLTDVMAGGAPSAEDAAVMNTMFGAFADSLVGWNLERENGTAVPPTLSGVREQDAQFTLALIGEWMKAAGGVPAPLGGSSTSGGIFPEASLPMEPLSASR